MNFISNITISIKLVFYNGVETIITNMLGSAVSDNFLKIYTQKNQYNFIISAEKKW